VKSRFLRLTFVLTLGLLLVMGGAVGCPAENGNGGGNDGGGGGGTASFSVSDLTITPENPGPGDTINITATVTNNGDASGSYQVVLTINGSTEDSETVNLSAGAKTGVIFDVMRNDAGTYQVAIGNLTGSFSVAATGQGILDAYLSGAENLTSVSFTAEQSTAMEIPGFGIFETVITVDGMYDFAGRNYHFYSESDTDGEIYANDTYLLGEWIYYMTDPPGDWYKTMLTPAEIDDEWEFVAPDSPDTIDFYGLAQVTIAGDDVVDGINCIKLVLMVSAADFWAYYGVDPTIQISEVVYEIWIADDNYYYIKDHVSFTMAVEGYTANYDATTYFFGHNEPVNIELPAEAAAATEI